MKWVLCWARSSATHPHASFTARMQKTLHIQGQITQSQGQSSHNDTKPHNELSHRLDPTWRHMPQTPHPVHTLIQQVLKLVHAPFTHRSGRSSCRSESCHLYPGGNPPGTRRLTWPRHRRGRRGRHRAPAHSCCRRGTSDPLLEKEWMVNYTYT